jgi:hypothetical protein
MACGQAAETPAPARPAPQGVLSAEWVYLPATAATAAFTGPVTVEASVGADGPARTVVGQKGPSVRAVLSGAMAMDVALAEALAQRPGAPATLYAVAEGDLCPPATTTHLVWAEPELIEGRTLAIAAISGGAPGQTGSTVCRVLRYTRDRGQVPGMGGSAREKAQ